MEEFEKYVDMQNSSIHRGEIGSQFFYTTK